MDANDPGQRDDKVMDLEKQVRLAVLELMGYADSSGFTLELPNDLADESQWIIVWTTNEVCDQAAAVLASRQVPLAPGTDPPKRLQ